MFIDFQMKKVDAKLTYTKTSYKEKYQSFLDSTPEGNLVNVFMEVAGERPTNLIPLKKVHAAIRDVAEESGSTETQIKVELKKKLGFKLKELEEYSCGDMSIEELTRMLEAAYELGEFVGIVNFRR